MSVLECVKTVKDPIIERPGGGDDDVYEPAPEDYAWWQLQVAAAEVRQAESAPLAAWLRMQAGCYRAGGARPGSHAAWLAARLDGLADLADFTGARTGDVLDDREATLSESRRE